MKDFTKAGAVFLCTTVLLAACAKNGGTGRDSALRIALEAAPTRLDPRFAMDAYSSLVDSLVFSSLLRHGDNGGYEPYLAESWEAADPLTWRFRLAPGYRFHDGTPVMPADVVATYRALLRADLGSPRRQMLTGVAAVAVEGDDGVIFRLTEPDAAFLEAATVGVLPARLAGAEPLEPHQLLGSGPYRVASYDRNGTIRLERVVDFASGTPSLPAIEFRVVPDALMRALELEHGSIDFVQNALDPDTVEWIEQRQGDLRVMRGPSANFQYLGMNLTHPALADVRVRRALAHAIDVEAVVTHLLAGQATVATGLLPPHHWAYDADVPRYDHSPQRARRLLDRAGLVDPDGPGPRPRLTLSYKTTTGDLPRRVAEAFASQLETVGIRLEILSYEWGTFFADVRSGRFHLYSLQWVGISDPDIYRQVFHSAMTPPNGNNRGRYHDRRMDRLTTRGRTTTDLEARKLVYSRVQRRAASRLPYVPLWWPERIVVASDRLEGFTPHPSGDLFGLARCRLRPDAAPADSR